VLHLLVLLAVGFHPCPACFETVLEVLPTLFVAEVVAELAQQGSRHVERRFADEPLIHFNLLSRPEGRFDLPLFSGFVPVVRLSDEC
jgi:hypothetical protein